ncbi:MAG: ATP-binding protein, partial [Gallicola sp.]|nr:ATP-binding protein [Gallicola sp.]
LWYEEKGANINLNFPEDEVFQLDFDEKLFHRLLGNILENSVHHNECGVDIFIEFSKSKKTLTFKDDGVGVPLEIRETLFEPMITGDESRTGENLRGLGLANVKRISDLHGWNVEYKDGILIKL